MTDQFLVRVQSDEVFTLFEAFFLMGSVELELSPVVEGRFHPESDEAVDTVLEVGLLKPSSPSELTRLSDLTGEMQPGTCPDWTVGVTELHLLSPSVLYVLLGLVLGPR